MKPQPRVQRAATAAICSGPYAGRRATLTTMHGKQTVIMPVFRDRLGLSIEVAPGIDTDTLGTFTGEVPRLGTIRDAAIAKARLGIAATGLPIAIASEGSYGPHPQIPFVAGGIELMVLLDDERGIVVTEHLIDDAPVFGHAIASNVGVISGFLRQIDFPNHAVVVRANAPADGDAAIHKGVRTTASLAEVIALCAASSRDGQALIQTDMRAHMNPTRMATIGRLATMLCSRLATGCPGCGLPGYGQIGVETGLPCSACGAPSLLVRHRIFGCASCDHSELRPRSDGRADADPAQCPECNP
ncbi:hypothetical protein KQX62_14960 [Rhodopseudomonas palustris]|uniref:DUF6671 domain-containing protein n=2 Tax=Rhodopseudomonas palustris TaxID=1076 RepID=A0AAX3DT80_RHOPL|nr:hypothetical protein KQX62_14960 [Rhodopseudomonas palustris]